MDERLDESVTAFPDGVLVRTDQSSDPKGSSNFIQTDTIFRKANIGSSEELDHNGGAPD